MPTADEAVRDDEANALFGGLEELPGLVLAVSGGPDSTALLVLAARWAKRLKRAPKLVAVTIDHGLRPEAAREAAAVKRLARRLGVPHRTLHWRGKKPKSGLQEAARIARYRLLAQAASRDGYAHILTAHTLDDQAETVLFRLARGSGVIGLAGMAHASPLPSSGESDIFLLRPLLLLPKARLIATLQAAGIAYSDDPTQSRSAVCAHALARIDAGARPRGARCARIGAARGAGAACRSHHRIRGRRRAGSAGAGALAAAWSDRGSKRRTLPCLPAEVALRLLGARLPMPGTRGRSNLPSWRRFTSALRQATASGCAGRWPARSLRWETDRLIVGARPRAAHISHAHGQQEALYEMSRIVGIADSRVLYGSLGFLWVPLAGGGSTPTLPIRDVKPPRFVGTH